MNGSIDASSIRNAINVCVINLFLPCLCIKVFYSSKIDFQSIILPISAITSIMASLIVAYLIYRFLRGILKLTRQQEGVLIIGSAFGNVTFLGLPVLVTTFGDGAAIYALYYDLFGTTPMVWLLGSYIAARFGNNHDYKLKEALQHLYTLPPLWGIAIGLCLNLTGLLLPSFVLNTISLLGGLVIPLMIFSIGLALEAPNVKHAYIIIPSIIVKLLFSPIISYVTAKITGLEGVSLNAALIEGAMPTMVVLLLISARFSIDVGLCAFLILITTLLSFLTLPIAVLLL
ncbi:MAG: AEC family transporter [Candidatus Magnetoovum sp. WYHC-5]|nr:AEC family transporter [Candidatus Magnetoovum sp. WYHC-5]